jgi:AcrR family transcriptional regulator
MATRTPIRPAGAVAPAAAGPATTTPASATRDPERTRARILAAATAEFARHGLGGARVDRIAAESGANKRMLYYYFGDKDRLFTAVMEAAYADIRSAEAELRLEQLPPAEAVRAMVRFTWEYYLAHPEFLTLLNSANLHRARHLQGTPELRELNSPVIALLREVLARGEREGLFRAGVDPLQLYISIAGICWFYLSNNHTLATVFDPSLADPARRGERLAHMQDLIVAGLSATTATATPNTPR